MTVFGPYRLETLLGRGGMGEFWRAVDTDHGDRPVAIKVLGTWLGGDEDFARRFRRGCALAAVQLNRLERRSARAASAA